ATPLTKRSVVFRAPVRDFGPSSADRHPVPRCPRIFPGGITFFAAFGPIPLDGTQCYARVSPKLQHAVEGAGPVKPSPPNGITSVPRDPAPILSKPFAPGMQPSVVRREVRWGPDASH